VPPWRKIDLKDDGLRLESDSLKDSKKAAFLSIASFNCAKPEQREESSQPYFKAPIDIDGAKVAPPKSLKLLKIPFKEGKWAALLVNPETDANEGLRDVSLSEADGALRISFSCGSRSYEGAVAANPAKKLSIQGAKGPKLEIENPAPGFIQLLICDAASGELQGVAANASGLSVDGRSCFKAAEGRGSLSALRLSDGSFLATVSAKATLSAAFGAKATSLVDAKELSLPAALEKDRLWIKP